jgi:hypothetical protein
MDNEKLLKIVAEAAGFDSVIGISPFMVRIAELAAAAERKACADLAEQGTGEPMQTRTLEICLAERQRIAAAIRARGN